MSSGRHWGKAARYSSRDTSPGGGGNLEEGEEAVNEKAVEIETQRETEEEIMEIEEEEEEDTLEIRPSLHGHRGSNRSGGGGGDLRALQGHRRDRDRSSDNNNDARSRDRGGDLRSSMKQRDHSSSRRDRHQKRGRRDREEGERDDVSSDGSRKHAHSPSMAPTSVAEAVQVDSTQERAMRERLEKARLEKARLERENRERQLQEALKKLGQDIMSPAQKAKNQPQKAKQSGEVEKKELAKTEQKTAEEKSEPTKEKLKMPSREMSTFVEEAQISSPESVEEPVLPAKKPKKTYEYSKFGDLDASSEESNESLSPRHRSRDSRSPAEPVPPQMTSMQRFLSERLDSSSRDGMSPAAIARRAVQELKNSPQMTGSPLHPGDSGGPGGAFASATFSDLFTDKPYEDSPKYIPPEIAALPPYFPALSGCRSVEEFECINRVDEGTYGVVYRAKEKKTDRMVALKRLKMEKEREGFPITSLREISTLLKAQHTNIVTVREIVVGSNMDKIYIVMDFVEHDLKALMESMSSPFLPGEVKTLMIQLLRGVAHMHDNWIIHRDLKTSNLLLSHRGVLKIGDFGLAREYGSPLKPYTQVVVTLWYRSPELLLGTKMYSTAVDMWSCGCIFAEMINKKPLFPGRTEMEELNKIFQILGTPNEKIWPGLSQLPGWKRAAFADQPYNSLRNKFEHGMLSNSGFSLLNAFLTYDPSRRISAADALKHPYFSENPLPVPPSMFPTWPAKSEGGQKPKKARKQTTPRAPEAGVGAYANMLGEDDDEERFKLNVAQGPSLFQIKP